MQFDEGAAKERMVGFCNTLKGFDRRDAKLLVERLFDPSTPTYQFSLRKGSECRDIPSGLLNRYSFFNITRELREILKARGYRELVEIWTGQEHRIIGSSNLNNAMAYVPIAVFENHLTLEEVRRARELSLVIVNAGHSYYCTDRKDALITGAVSLEPLDMDGKTIRDPRAIDLNRLDAALREGATPAEALDFADMLLEKKGDFPYSRAGL